MDFDKLDLRKAAETKYWVQLRMGETLLFADMPKRKGPCQVELLSPANPKAKAAVSKVVRFEQELRALGNKLTDTLTAKQRQHTRERQVIVADEFDEAVTEFLCAVITDWRNIEKGGKALAFSPEALEDMAETGAPLSRVVLDIIEDMAKTQEVFTPAANAS